MLYKKIKLMIVIMMSIVPLPLFSQASTVEESTIAFCLNEGPVSAIAGCFTALELKRNADYNRTYQTFINEIIKNKSNFLNYNGFLQKTKKAKGYFDKYMQSECQAWADQVIIDSPAWHALYSQCMIRFYEQRINFYNKYDFQ